MSTDHDVVIVGAGPAGCRIAEETASRGYRTLVLEEHRKVGRPVQCAGLISPRTFKLASPPRDAILARIRGAEVIGPDNNFDFYAEDLRGVVIDRSAFDSFLAGRAINAGAEIRTGMKVESIEPGVVMAHGEKCTSSVIVGADGPASLVRRSMDFNAPRHYFACVQQDMPDWEGPDDTVAVIVDQDISPGFFAWAVPFGEGARVGTGVAPGTIPAAESLDRAVKRFTKMGRLTSDKNTTLSGGVIPIGPLSKISSENALIAGDAAAQVKPVSGGGLYPGLNAAVIAGKAIDGYLSGNSPLKAYDREWRNSFLGELNFGLKVREAYLSMDNKEVIRVLTIAEREKVRDAISRHGDIDHPSVLAGPLIKSAPDLVGKVALSIFGDTIRHLRRKLGFEQSGSDEA